MKALIQHMTFRVKLALVYFLLLLIVGSLSMYILYQSMVVSTYKQHLTASESILDSEISNVNNRIDNIKNLTSNLLRNQIINDYLLNAQSRDGDKIIFVNKQLTPFFNWVFTTNPDIMDVRFYTDDPIATQYYKFQSIDNERISSYFNVIKEKMDITPSYFEPLHSNARCIYPVASEQNVYSYFFNASDTAIIQNNLYVEVEISPNALFPFLEYAPQKDTPRLIVYTKNGILLKQWKENDIQLIQQLLQYDILETPTIYGLEDEYLAKTVYLSPLETYISLLIPMTKQNLQLQKTSFNFALILIGVIFCLATISYILARLMLSKITKATAIVNHMDKYKYKTQIPVHGQDEIDTLFMSINKMTDKINTLFNKVYKANIAQKDAEIYALQAQINPHFINNTLEAIKMMAVINDQTQIEEALTALGGMMEYSIVRNEKSTFTLLKNELLHAQDYVKLMNLFTPITVELEIDNKNALSDAYVPRHMLQPIIENSIEHGITSELQSLTISIFTSIRKGRLEVVIMDNGQGMKEERFIHVCRNLHDFGSQMNKDHAPIHHIALNNINARIQLQFGADYGLSVHSVLGKGTTITCILPILYEVPQSDTTFLNQPL